MAHELASSLVGAASNMFGTFFNGLTSAQAADNAYSRQRELMSLQNQYAIENFNRENAYNSPKEQMRRLREAGLNPALMYQNGAAGVSGNIAAPAAPAAPMQSTTPADFSRTATDAANVALALGQAKKAGEEGLAQEILNGYLGERTENEIKNLMLQNQNLLADLGIKDAQQKNIVQSTKNLVAEAYALEKRIGFEAVDRIVSSYNAYTQRMLAENKITDDEATRQARIFSLVAKGKLDQANEYLIGLFKDPEKFHSFVKGWIAEIRSFISGDGKTDSQGHGPYNPFNKDPESPVAQGARSIFLWLDDWLCSWTGAEPIKK